MNPATKMAVARLQSAEIHDGLRQMASMKRRTNIGKAAPTEDHPKLCANGV